MSGGKRMNESNFAITEPKKEKEAEEKYVPLTSKRFVRQKKGLKAVRQRKRRERHALNKLLHAPRKAKKAMKKQGMTDNVQRGFDTAKRWKDKKDLKEFVESKEESIKYAAKLH